MDAASILVLVLTAGVAALLVWFEINSRRNCREQELKSRASVSEPENRSPDGERKGPVVAERKKVA